jgi:hypothetical protein
LFCFRDIFSRFSTWLYELDPAFKAAGVLSLCMVAGSQWLVYKIDKEIMERLNAHSTNVSHGDDD